MRKLSNHLRDSVYRTGFIVCGRAVHIFLTMHAHLHSSKHVRECCSTREQPVHYKRVCSETRAQMLKASVCTQSALCSFWEFKAQTKNKTCPHERATRARSLARLHACTQNLHALQMPCRRLLSHDCCTKIKDEYCNENHEDIILWDTRCLAFLTYNYTR